MKRAGFALRIPDTRAKLEVPAFKKKKCKTCGEVFQATRQIQPTCSFECSIKYADKVLAKSKAKLAAEDKRNDRERREKLKTRSDYIKEAQREFNRFIRARDSSESCICCQQPLGSGEVGGAYDAGHYRSVGSAPHLRFDERNCHAQTKKCNRYGAGRAVDYRLGLIGRLGAGVVEALEADQEPKHYTIEDLKAIKAEYRARTKALQAAAESA